MGEGKNSEAENSNYDWFAPSETANADVLGTVSEEQKQSSMLVPVLVGVLCLLIAIVVVGAVVIFQQRDKDESLSQASLETESSAKVSSSGMDLSPKDSGTEGKTSGDPCLSFPVKPGQRLIFKEETAEDPSPDDTGVPYCDGEWAVWGPWGTDAISAPLHWSGSEWVDVGLEPDGRAEVSGYPCYNRATLEREGVSEGLIESGIITLCASHSSDQENSSAGNSENYPYGNSETPSKDSTKDISALSDYKNPSCDGRYILIADSVIVPDGGDATAMVYARLQDYPGAVAANPGACPSLRAVDLNTGGRIYPIYYDYGFDLDAVCAAYGTKGDHGDVRTLTNVQGQYRNPCV